MTDVAGKCKKRERNKVICQKYCTEQRQEKNALVRLFRHIRTHCKGAVGPDRSIITGLLPKEVQERVAFLRKELSVIALREAERSCGWRLA